MFKLNAAFLKDKKCPGSSLCDTKMSRYVLPQICLLMAIFKPTSRYNTVQDEYHYKTLDKKVKKLKTVKDSMHIIIVLFQKCPDYLWKFIML